MGQQKRSVVKIQVGKARFDEIFSIEQLLESGRDEMRTPLPPTDIPYAYHRLIDFIQTGFVWVARTESEVVGIIILRPSSLWFVQRAHFLESIEFYIAPDYRKGGVAAKLLGKAKDVAAMAAVGGVPLVVNLTSGNMAEMKDRFVESQGFTYMGGALVWQVEAPEKAAEEDSVPVKEAV